MKKPMTGYQLEDDPTMSYFPILIQLETGEQRVIQHPKDLPKEAFTVVRVKLK